MQSLNSISVVPLFGNLSPSQLDSIGAHAALRVVEKGEIILRRGEIADSCYLIVSGQVKVFMSDNEYTGQESDREVILKTLGPGDFFGELPMFDQEPRIASVAALDQVHLQVLSYKAFQRAIEESPEIARVVMKTLAARLRHADQKIGALAMTDITSRVSRTLLELAIMSNGRRVVGSPFTQQDLADMVGASREMVNRTLKDLEGEGYIDVQRKMITILDDRLSATL